MLKLTQLIGVYKFLAMSQLSLNKGQH